jgi:CheY-like chemotaxis protein
MTAHQTHTVLLADDDNAVLSVLQNALTLVGYQVLVAGDGREALALVPKLQLGNEGQPRDGTNLLITDLQMPHMSGLELARHLLKQRPDMPIIFTSADPGAESLLAAEAFPNYLYLRKPFLPSELVALVPRLLALNIPSGEW